jgi:long-subunit acyl-CoA synthetase (AMP-forming)
MTAFIPPPPSPLAQVRAALQDVVTRANARAVSNAARIAKWTLVAPDFSVGGGELTPTLKLKRRVVCDRYAAVIEGLYAEAEGGAGGGAGFALPGAKL